VIILIQVKIMLEDPQWGKATYSNLWRWHERLFTNSSNSVSFL